MVIITGNLLKTRIHSACLGILIVSLILYLAGCDDDHRIRTQTVRITSLDQVIPVNDSLVQPVLYTHVSGFEKLPVATAKAKFIAALLPAILIARYETLQHRQKLEILRTKQDWSRKDSSFYLMIQRQYRAKGVDDLIIRMGVLPVSIILAQAAMESGWGKSRFFVKGNNVFGIWSYLASEPRIPALIKRQNKTIYLKAYPDLSHAIVNYFEVIGRAKSYRKLRAKLEHTRDPMALLPYLNHFSERGSLYTRQLRKVIAKNNLTKYDHYAIDPAYID